MRFLDTNILLYSISTLLKEAPKAAIARQILRSRDLVLSVQGLQEFYVQATRPSRPDPLSHDEALAFIETWKRFPIVDVTLGLFDEAVKVKLRYQLSCWDAAIIAAARVASVKALKSIPR
jgi:predicted nucleic acid-binding protein